MVRLVLVAFLVFFNFSTVQAEDHSSPRYRQREVFNDGLSLGQSLGRYLNLSELYLDGVELVLDSIDKSREEAIRKSRWSQVGGSVAVSAGTLLAAISIKPNNPLTKKVKDRITKKVAAILGITGVGMASAGGYVIYVNQKDIDEIRNAIELERQTLELVRLRMALTD